MKLSEIFLTEMMKPSVAEMQHSWGAWVHGKGKYYPVLSPMGHAEMVESNPEYFGYDSSHVPGFHNLFKGGWVRVVYGKAVIYFEGMEDGIRSVWSTFAPLVLRENLTVDIEALGEEGVEGYTFNLPSKKKELIQWMNQ